MKKFFKKFNKPNKGFTRLVDFGDAISSRTKSASPKLTTGFTFIETLVAVSIFTVSILSLFAVLGQSIASSNYAKTKIIGSYLAQEGVEHMRNMRDTYVLYTAGGSQVGWDNFKNNLKDVSDCQGINGCYFNADNINYIDTTQPIIDIPLTACGATCPILLYNATTGKYGYTGASSIFTRKIRILSEPSVDEIKIASTVSWAHPSGNYTITFSENLFNWIQ